MMSIKHISSYIKCEQLAQENQRRGKTETTSSCLAIIFKLALLLINEYFLKVSSGELLPILNGALN